MTTLPISADGQIALSKELLDHLGVRPGDQVTVDLLSQAVLEIKADRRTGQISDVFGLLKNKVTRALSIEEINDAAADGWAKRDQAE